MNSLHFKNLLINTKVSEYSKILYLHEDKTISVIRGKEEFTISVKDEDLENNKNIENKEEIKVHSLMSKDYLIVIYYKTLYFVPLPIDKDIVLNKKENLYRNHSIGKKITCCLLNYFENRESVIFADKIGDIYLLDLETFLNEKNKIHSNKIELEKKEVNDDEDEENTSNKRLGVYLLYGHSDGISFIRKTKKYLITSDSIGKIKITNFPNIFELESVIIYENYYYIDEVNDEQLFVINKDYSFNLWNLNTFKMTYTKSFFKTEEISENIYRCFKTSNMFVIITKKAIDNFNVFLFEIRNEEINLKVKYEFQFGDIENNEFWIDENLKIVSVDVKTHKVNILK